MEVSDEVLATLRTGLSGNAEAHLSRWNRLGASARIGYRALVSAALAEAAGRRFASADPAAEVIEYVARVRSSSGLVAGQVDPLSAERLILSACAGGDADGIDPGIALRTRLVLLAGLVAEAGMAGAALDQLLGAAREVADQWLAAAVG
jgi:MoxR-like ATPase